MHIRCFALLLLIPSLTAHAQSDDKLHDLLVDKPLYLRGQWESDKLSFDSTGTLRGKSKTVPFTLSGIQIDSVHTLNHHLTITGHRYGIEFSQKLPMRIELEVGDGPGKSRPEAITIEVEDSGIGPVYDFLMEKIFFTRVNQFLPLLPDYWQGTAAAIFPVATQTGESSIPSPTNAPPPPAPKTEATNRVGGAVKPPRLLKQSDPSFSQAARTLRFSGETLISLHVEADGKPSHIRILRPIGLGLDEKAVEAVSKYVFAPALKDGTPVSVLLNVAVNFQIM